MPISLQLGNAALVLLCKFIGVPSFAGSSTIRQSKTIYVRRCDASAAVAESVNKRSMGRSRPGVAPVFESSAFANSATSAFQKVTGRYGLRVNAGRFKALPAVSERSDFDDCHGLRFAFSANDRICSPDRDAICKRSVIKGRLPQRDAKAPSQRRPLLVSRSRANYKRTRLEQVHQLNRARFM